MLFRSAQPILRAIAATVALLATATPARRRRRTAATRRRGRRSSTSSCCSAKTAASTTCSRPSARPRGQSVRQPAVRGHRQRRRHPRPELRPGAAMAGLRHRHLLDPSGEDDAVRAAAAAFHRAVPRPRRRSLRSAAAQAAEPALPADAYRLLTTGGTGLPAGSPTRVFRRRSPTGRSTSRSIGYDDYASNPVHRFFQMWQQLDCERARRRRTTRAAAGPTSSRGSRRVGAGSNGKPQPAGFNDQSTGEGATAMGVYNMPRAMRPI